MNNKIKKLIFVIFILLLSVLFFYTQKKSTEIENKTEIINVQTFSVFPDSIDGGACMFFKNVEDSNAKNYLLVNDMAFYAYMKINDQQEKFETVSFEDATNTFHYENNYYNLTMINQTSEQKSEESRYISGLLILEEKSSGINLSLQYVGKCEF
jgi:hypothetical protein